MPRNDDEGDYDRPEDERARADDDDRSSKKRGRTDEPASEPKPLPLRLIGVVIASIGWGGYMLYGGCVNSVSSAISVIQITRRDQRIRELGFFQNQMFEQGDGFTYTMAAEHILMMLLAATLLVGGITLLIGKGFGKYLAMGAPIAMILVELIIFVVCLIVTSGSFLNHHNAVFFVNIIFSLAIGGCNIYLLLDKKLAKVLR